MELASAVVVQLRNPPHGASDEHVQRLETVLGRRLPDAYRRFLLRHDGGIPEPNEFAIQAANNASGVNRFWSVDEIREDREAYGIRLPNSVVPIAIDSFGNRLCINLDDGRVYFWDHELEHRDPFFVVADDFAAFWKSLERSDPNDVELKPGQVKSVWVDPDLLGGQS